MLDFPTGIQVLVLSSILYWLRETIDRQKGALIECLAVTAPVALTAVNTEFKNPGQNAVEFGLALMPFIVFVFLSLPTIVGLRLAERLADGEQPGLADIFRITTITSLSIFVIQQLEIESSAIFFVSVLTVAYLVGDCIEKNARPLRRVSWLVVAAVCFVVLRVIIANTMPLRNYDGNFSGFVQTDILIGLVFAPAAWHLLFENIGRFVSVGYWIEVIRQRYIRPRDAIYHRTIFRLWRIRPGVCYLNHGSFGAVPQRVQRVHHAWQTRCEAEPMDILVRHTERQWRNSRDRLAYWLGSPPERMALCENATMGMNEIASWFPLLPGQEILLTDHEYGPVKRIWQRRAEDCGAVAKIVRLSLPFTEPSNIVETILAECSPQTRLVVFSHITSPTATVLPVVELCRELRSREIASCVDGPHALLQERVHLTKLDCDFYTGSCNKWLCAPLGSGFLYVHPRWDEQIRPMRLSWGLLPPALPGHWVDELTWVGTRDYSAYMAVPAAIDFFANFEYERLDERNHELALYARRVLSKTLGTEPLTPPSRLWMGWMAAVWLPPGDHSRLQQRLWDRWKIEVLIPYFSERYLVRVSCHLYNSTHEVDRLARALVVELRAGN